MTNEEIQYHVTAVMIMTLQEFSDNEIAAAYNALCFFKRIVKGNCSYEKCVSVGFINSDGTPYELEELKEACARVITQRMKNENFKITYKEN